jgi:SAM-dependent methyltransferase
MEDRGKKGVAEFWDQNPHVAEDPEFWMAHPLCRRGINRRVSGRDSVWPLDFLYERAGSPRFDTMLSLGSGMGHVERAIRRLDIAGTVEAIDGSSVSVDIAKQKAAEEGLAGITYSVADLNRLSLPRRRYPAIVFHQSLHHVFAVERLLDVVRTALKPEGLLFLEEWTGPSRTEWTRAKMDRLDALFQEIPLEWRKGPELKPPIEEHDPTEAVRSSAIRPGVRRLFRILVDRPYGGQLVSVFLPQLRRDLIPPAALDALLARWLALESEELASNPDASFYNAILATPKTGPRAVAGRIANAAVRGALALAVGNAER